LEREIASSIFASLNYTYVNTVWVARERDTNLPVPVKDATGRNIYNLNNRPYGPKFARATVTEAAGRSLYRGLTAQVSARKSRYVVDLYYTRSWNYNYDDIERGFTGIALADSYDIAAEYGFSDIDEPHVFMGNINYFLPFGVEVGSSMKFTSGRPITARAGTDLNGDGNNTDRPIENGLMFARNTHRNAGFKDVSLRLQKNFSLRNERGTISVSAEAFNLIGFKNVRGAIRQVYGAGTLIQNGVLVPQNPSTTPANANFAKIKDSNGNYVSGTTAGDARTIQLGLRFQF
jgi:hypothetical protein